MRQRRLPDSMGVVNDDVDFSPKMLDCIKRQCGIESRVNDIVIEMDALPKSGISSDVLRLLAATRTLVDEASQSLVENDLEIAEAKLDFAETNRDRLRLGPR